MKDFNRDDRTGSRRPSRFRDNGPKSFVRRDSSPPRERDSGRFERRDSDRSSESERSFGGRSSGRFGRDSGRSSPGMHHAVCAKCGEDCDVPFKPTSGKPVYCSNCFRKDDKYESKGPVQSSNELDQINKKLDKIMKALKIG